MPGSKTIYTIRINIEQKENRFHIQWFRGMEEEPVNRFPAAAPITDAEFREHWQLPGRSRTRNKKGPGNVKRDLRHMKIIADTGPLIGLAKIDRLSTLKRIFPGVCIPPMVYRELLGKISEESERIEKALDEFIQVDEIKTFEAKIKKMLLELGAGERQVIILALSFSNDVLLLLDDRAVGDKFDGNFRKSIWLDKRV